MFFNEMTRNDVWHMQAFRDPLNVGKQEFIDMLMRHFREYLDDYANCTHSESVDFIWRSSEYFWSYLQREELEDVYIEVIFSLFESIRCTDYGVIRNLLEGYTLRRLQFYGFIQTDIRLPLLLRPSPLCGVLYCADPLLFENFTLDSFFYPHLYLELEVAQRLLRYGVPLYMEDHCARYYLSFILSCINDQPLTPISKSMEWENEEICLSNSRFMHQSRLNILLMGLHVLCVKKKRQNFNNYQNYTESLKLIFKTIKEPFITLSEIAMFLELNMKVEDKEQKIRDYCNEFAEDFPKSRDVLQPRTLKHLCRCEVRECLVKSKKLPHGVWNLSIPKRMQNYILIQTREDEFYPKYVSALSSIAIN